MSRLFLGGFVLISAAAAGAVDYVNQARRAGSAPGAFAVSAYLDTVSGRIAGRPTPAAEGGTAAAAAAPALPGGQRENPTEGAGPASGGVLGMIGGFLGGTADAASRGADTPKPEVRVNGLGGNCNVAGGIKRCSLGGD